MGALGCFPVRRNVHVATNAERKEEVDRSEGKVSAPAFGKARPRKAD